MQASALAMVFDVGRGGVQGQACDHGLGCGRSTRRFSASCRRRKKTSWQGDCINHAVGTFTHLAQALDPRLVTGAPHPGRVDDKPADLGVLAKRIIEFLYFKGPLTLKCTAAQFFSTDIQ